MSWIAFLTLLFGLSWAGIGIFRWYAVDKGMIDYPNARSSHIAPTPRGGGVVFFIGWLILIGTLYYYGIVNKNYLWLFSPAACMGLLGFWDDYKELSTGLRFLIQCLVAAASLFLLGEGGMMVMPWLSFPLPLCFLFMIFVIVWIVNLYNFMDGADGIAASEGLIIFAVGGYLLFQYHAYELATLAWGLAALIAGFLTWNWPTARIFMGDCGSYFLGFMVSLYALISYKQFNMPLMIWVILTALFWFDTTITLLRRMLAGDNWQKPHRKHAYQRLIQAGWSHQKVLIAIWGVNAILSYLAWLVHRDPKLTVFALCVTVTFLSCLYLLVEIAKPMYKTWHSDKPAQPDV